MPEYDDGLDPTYKFTSLTTDSLTNTEILTTKIDVPPTDFSLIFHDEFGNPVDEDEFTLFGTQIYNIGVGDGVTELALEICLPIESGIVATGLFFFDPDLDAWTPLVITSIDLNDNDLICGDSDHVSSWAVGGVKALAGGGIAGGALAPSFTGKYFDEPDKSPLEINGVTYDLPEYKNKVDKQIIAPGEPVEFKFTLFEVTGGENIQHFEFLINLTGKLREYHNSDTYIIYEKGDELIIRDPHGLFENVDFNIESANFYEGIVTVNLTFAKEMDESDIIIRVWDSQRFSEDTVLVNAL
ncbi:hypothetical protein IIB51_01605, partial [Patescibacteria group bacterium]|nr:hypothetical protein [Patescibacteria group bacterium]